MKYVVDAPTMGEIDQYTIDEIGIPSFVLMEKAAMKLAEFMSARISRQDKILSVCGVGNNGGDGAAAARLLHQTGYQVDILLVGDEERASEQMKTQLKIVRNLGMSVYNSAKVSEYTVIIDGIFGVGLKRPIEGKFEEIIQEINRSGAKIFAVDLPTGIHGTTGKILNIAIKAHYTVTFGYCKLGLLLYPGCEYAGEVAVVDIGFSDEPLKHREKLGFYYEEEDLARLPARKARGNKGSFGRVLVIAGSHGVSGAAYLSAKAAYRVGAGLVKIITPESNRTILQSLLPEALLCTYESKFKSLDWLKQELEWANVVVLGPGIGMSAEAKKIFDYVMENIKIPLILDADAINLLADDKKYVIKDKKKHSITLQLPDNVILTPHLKEMSRLVQLPLRYIVENTLEVAEQYHDGCVLVLKDARTIVQDNEHFYINVSGNDGMATGGSGDVLTGIIAGFIAQGMNCFEASAMGVYVHGLAGDYVTSQKNAYSLMASDIMDALSCIL